MRILIIAASVAALALPVSSASAQWRVGVSVGSPGYYGNGYGYGYNRYGRNDYRQELRECRRELRHADSRREYRRELRECRRELAMARRGNRYGYYGYGGNSGRYSGRYYDGYTWRYRY